jgi:hypothetical protein
MLLPVRRAARPLLPTRSVVRERIVVRPARGILRKISASRKSGRRKQRLKYHEARNLRDNFPVGSRTWAAACGWGMRGQRETGPGPGPAADARSDVPKDRGRAGDRAVPVCSGQLIDLDGRVAALQPGVEGGQRRATSLGERGEIVIGPESVAVVIPG